MGDVGFLLRAATGDDAEFREDMLVAAVNWDPAREVVSRDQALGDRRIAHYLEGWPWQGDLGVVAVEPGGGVIGAVWLRLFSADDPGYGFVAADIPELSLGVVPSWRGKGVGRALLTEMARRAEESDFTRISLSVERANPARRLYADEGFTTVESGPDSDTMIKIVSGR
ncbi:GNAT family N-acetyltransferase [Streptomyces sp. H10-C2]|uniref:GNAT family N-acetyltransferase n=1 Tax=unclassified Streptomyces TaxID=2593676 RepID=UPI0024BB438B|nr:MULTISPECIES: GNAT family N-acetyltransferase [unclassified Streptomyces]MDJ0344769.1 GNAT family N-acetyltransferase [Streptomyces sp. PH10-H1]MDJ0369654.1 GNAT family N-acetyltransferase [Streptomyces sp. H10-C2]